MSSIKYDFLFFSFDFKVESGFKGYMGLMGTPYILMTEQVGHFLQNYTQLTGLCWVEQLRGLYKREPCEGSLKISSALVSETAVSSTTSSGEVMIYSSGENLDNNHLTTIFQSKKRLSIKVINLKIVKLKKKKKEVNKITQKLPLH